MPGAIPIGVGVTEPTPGGDGIFVTVIIDQASTTDSTVSLDVSHPELISSALGGWPLQVSIPADHTSVTVWLDTSAVTNNTYVFVAVGQSGADLSDAGNICAAGIQVLLAD